MFCSCSSDAKPTEPDADPSVPDAVKIDAPKAGMTQVSWTLTKNGAPATCATMDPPSPDIKVTFFEGTVSKGIKRVPCADGKAIINIPPGNYRLAVNIAPANDPVKSGVEYASKDVVVPVQGIMETVTLPQVAANFTWSVANVPNCNAGGSNLVMKMDKTTVVNVACSAGSATANVPAASKAVVILVGSIGQETSYDKTVVIPANGGNVALPIP
jgi:hypothetical protein